MAVVLLWAHVELGVGGGKGVGCAETVAEFSTQLAGERRGAEGQVRGGGEIPGIRVEAGSGRSALAKGGLQSKRGPFTLRTGQEGEATADAPLAAIVAKEQHPRGGGPAEAASIGKPAEATSQLSGGGGWTLSSMKEAVEPSTLRWSAAMSDCHTFTLAPPAKLKKASLSVLDRPLA